MSIRLLKPLSNRDYRLLWSGQAISYVGNGVMLVALSWEALALSPHATSLSIVFVARSVPLLMLSLIGGAITDRVPRRAVLLASEWGRALVVAIAAVLIGSGAIRFWHIVALSACFGAAEAFFFPAFGAIVPQLVGPDQLVQANSLESAIRPLAARMLGPALGGVIVAGVGASWAFWFDGATFVVSGICVLLIRMRSAPERAEPTPITKDIADGYRYTRSQPWIWTSLVMAAFAVLSFMGPMDVLLPIYTKRHLLAGARGYGFLIGSMGAGGILGAIVVAQSGTGRRRVRNTYLVWALTVIPFAFLPATRTLAIAMALMALLGAGFEAGTVMWISLLQDLVPGRLQGRVRSLDFMVSFALMPLSYAIAGPLASAIGTLRVIAIGGALASAVTFAFMLYPRVFDPDRDDYVPEPGSLAATRRSSTSTETAV